MKVKDYKATLMGLGVIFLVLLATRGGLASLVPLLRIAAPFGVAYFIYRTLKRKVISATEEMMRRTREQAGQGMDPRMGPRGDQGQRVIDLCPKCGGYMAKGHRCP